MLYFIYPDDGKRSNIRMVRITAIFFLIYSLYYILYNTLCSCLYISYTNKNVLYKIYIIIFNINSNSLVKLKKKNLYNFINLNFIIWGLCNRKEGNCQEKPNLLLYTKYVFYAEIRPDLALTHFLFFPVVSSLSIAKAPSVNRLINRD